MIFHNVLIRAFILILLCLSLILNAQRILPQENLDNDVRISFMQDIIHTSTRQNKILSPPNTFGYTNVEPYKKENVVFVSAVNTLMKLDVKNFTILQMHTWKISPDEISRCHNEIFKNEHCGKYQVKLILLRNISIHQDVLFVCHTDGSKPSCSERNVENITTLSRDWVSEENHYPIDPNQNITALIASDGHLYLGSVAGSPGRRSMIIRVPIDKNINKKVILNTRSSMTWLQLSDPVSFTNSFELGPSVFFVFRESAEEFEIRCQEKAMLSRIARVCKADKGGYFKMNNIWTSFAKASLICPTSGVEGNRIFGLIQDSSIDKNRGIFSAIFTTHESGPAGSMLCEYTLESIERVFKGPYLNYKSWSPSPKNSSRDCSQFSSPNKQHFQSDIFQEADEYQMMYHPILPISNKNLFRKDYERWYHLIVDNVKRGGVEQRVYFVATSRGSIRKLMQVRDKMCEIEEIFLDRYKTLVINDMKATWEYPIYLIVSTNVSIFRIAVERCYRLNTEALCTAANDPYCYWDSPKQSCQAIHTLSTTDRLFPIHDCPKLDNIPINGGWNTWSSWSPCQYNSWPASKNDAQRVGPEGCFCRTRICDSPRPLAGGHTCQGESVQVFNCSGWWSGWSDWSTCSKSCGHGMKTRSRQCTSIEGVLAKCRGESTDQKPCMIIPNCPTETLSALWSAWGLWSKCEHKCTDGYQKRHRSCKPIEDGNVVCKGNSFEIRKCLNNSCPEQAILSRWTEWMDLPDLKNVKRQRRYRASCVGRALDSRGITAEVLLSERPCKDSLCETTENGSPDNRYEAWSQWSACSKLCGGGFSTRRRKCLQTFCNAFIEERPCNTQKCQGFWNCWGDWSACSEACGFGIQKRVRLCKDIEGNDSADCTEGNSVEQRKCEAPVKCRKTTGWLDWEAWSDCSPNYQRVRRRQCLGESPHAVIVEELCIGDKEQIETCLNAKSSASRFEGSNGFKLIHIVAVGSVCFLLGAFIIVVILLILYKRRKRYGRTSKSDKTTIKTNSTPNMDSIGLLDGNSSVYHPGTSSVPPTPQRRMDEISSPWHRQSTVDDAVLLYGTYTKSGRHRDGLMESLERSHSRYIPEPHLPQNTYPTMPVRNESSLQSGMSTFGRGSKRDQPLTESTSSKRDARCYVTQYSEPSPRGGLWSQNEL